MNADEIRTAVDAFLVERGITIGFEFVPFSKSRNAGEETPSLNWLGTITRGRKIVNFDYMQGSGFCPSYKQNPKDKYAQARCVAFECESGRRAFRFSDTFGVVGGKNQLDQPTAADALHCLLLDSEVLDYGSFEDWADEFGYDQDSRKAEKIYRECLDIALKLSQIFNEQEREQLRELLQDY